MIPSHPFTRAVARSIAPLTLAFACAAPLAAHAVTNPLPPDSPTPSARSSIRTINQMARMMPPVSDGVAANVTAACRDGTASRNKDAISACMYHGGIERWFGPQPERTDGDSTQMAARG